MSATCGANDGPALRQGRVPQRSGVAREPASRAAAPPSEHYLQVAPHGVIDAVTSQRRRPALMPPWTNTIPLIRTTAGRSRSHLPYSPDG